MQVAFGNDAQAPKLTNNFRILLTYQSNQPLNVILNDGTSDGGNFMAFLPAAATATERTLTCADFRQARWAQCHATIFRSDRNLSAVNGIGFSIVTEDGEHNGKTMNATITRLIIETTGGVACETPVRPTNCGGEPTDPSGDLDLLTADMTAGTSWFAVFGHGSNSNSTDFANVTDIVKKEGEVSWKAWLSDDFPENQWPYASMNVWFETGTLKNDFLITLTYTSDRDMNIVLDDGSTTGDNFRHVLTSGTNVTVTLSGKDFSQPSWATARNLNLSNVKGLYFEVNTEQGYGVTLNAKITKLTVGTGGAPWVPTEPTDPSSLSQQNLSRTSAFAITGISAGRLNLSVPSAGSYTVAIYSVDGRILARTRANLTQGVNALPIAQNLSRGVVIVRVQGANNQLVRKISVQ